MTPKEALVHLEFRIHRLYPLCPNCELAISVLRALVEGPTIRGDDYQKLLLSLANILCKLQPTWAFTGEPFVTLNAIERALELQPTVQEVREEIVKWLSEIQKYANTQRILTNDQQQLFSEGAIAVLLNLLDFIDRGRKEE